MGEKQWQATCIRWWHLFGRMCMRKWGKEGTCVERGVAVLIGLLMSWCLTMGAAAAGGVTVCYTTMMSTGDGVGSIWSSWWF
ncbi:hypothetical protein J3F83DRAFT_110424 [Trichoderma novae-zelandiae]